MTTGPEHRTTGPEHRVTGPEADGSHREPGPLRSVLAAVNAGAADPGEVATRTGLDRGVVSAAVAHLVRSGYLRSEQLTSGCPPAGCTSCGSQADEPDARCHATGTGRGPVLIALTRPRRGQPS